MNRYEIGKTKCNNTIYDWPKICNDMKRVIERKLKWNKSLYEPFMMRHTIAHYNWRGWLSHYNENWSQLAREIETRSMGDINYRPEDVEALEELRLFLVEHDGYHAKVA